MEYSVGDITYAAYNVDAAVDAGEVVAGSNLFTGDPTISPTTMSASTPGPNPTFPVVVGEALTGTWRSLQAMPSSTVWGGLAVCGYFRRIA